VSNAIRDRVESEWVNEPARIDARDVSPPFISPVTLNVNLKKGWSIRGHGKFSARQVEIYEKSASDYHSTKECLQRGNSLDWWECLEILTTGFVKHERVTRL